jgi:hypothetical protein
MSGVSPLSGIFASSVSCGDGTGSTESDTPVVSVSGSQST